MDQITQNGSTVLSAKKTKRPGRSYGRGDSEYFKPDTITKAREIVRPLLAAGASIGARKLAEEHPGVAAHVTFDCAIAAEWARLEAFAEVGAAADFSSMTAKQKRDAAIKTHKKELERDFARRLMEENLKHIERIFPTLQQEKNDAYEREQTYRRFMQQQEKIFTDEEFKAILRCLHPDSNPSPEIKTEAFRLMTSKRFALTGNEK